MLKMTFPKVIDVVQAKMKNRRMQIKRYSDNSYLIQFKRLAKDLDGRLATPVERMVLSNEAFEILIGGGLTLIERKNRKSRKEGEGMVRCKFTGKGEVKFPHDNPDLCPTYFDGCNCLATSLEQMSAIANDAQLEAGDLEDEVKRLRAIIEGLECYRHCKMFPEDNKCQVCRAKAEMNNKGKEDNEKQSAEEDLAWH